MELIIAILINLIALLPVLMNGLKEKHFVKRGNVSINGLASIGVGVGWIITTSSLSLKMVHGTFLVLYGMLIIYLINTDWSKAQKIGQGKIVFLILLILGIIQTMLSIN